MRQPIGDLVEGDGQRPACGDRTQRQDWKVMFVTSLEPTLLAKSLDSNAALDRVAVFSLHTPPICQLLGG